MNANQCRFEISNLKLICVHLCSSAVLLSFCNGCQQLGPVGEFARNTINFMSGNTPVNAALKMQDRYFPDERRQGINHLSDYSFGRQGDYTKRYQQIAQTDSDWLVRATAIRALNRSRDASATPTFIKALSDQNDIVRVEAAKALANIPDNNAIPALAKAVADPSENKDVRVWAADALKNYRTLDAARALAGQLDGREFAVAWQSHNSLILLTGRDLRYDPNAWLQYLTGPDKPFG
jgi:HEAT repeat protein